MAKTLVIDTTSRFLTVGVVNEDKIKEISYECWQRQSEFCILEISKLLKKSHLKPQDIEEIIVSVGPGSYTGIRIALTIAKVWSLTNNVKIYPISSLQAMCDPTEQSIALLDARANRFYVAMFDKTDCKIKDSILEKEDLLKLINDNPTYKLVGDLKFIDKEEVKLDLTVKMNKWKQYISVCEDNDKLTPVYLKEAI